MNGVRALRGPVVWVLAWVLVVAVVATTVWLVISRAGVGVTSSETRVDGAPPDGPTTTRTPPPTRTPSAPTRSPSAPTRSPSATTAAPTAEPEPPDQEPEPAPEPVQRTASGARGSITVECTGTSARLAGATPRAGATSEVEDAGPDRVRVDFEDDEGRTRIEASCVGGAPAFSVDDD